jgi:membrane fusion protein, multidrug efflux system
MIAHENRERNGLMLHQLAQPWARRHAAHGSATWPALLLVAALAACHAEKPKAPGGGAEPGEPSRPVVTAAVVRTEGGEVAVPATVRARRRAALASRISASVVEVPHREGERVEAGAVVVRLDAAALQSSVAAAEAARNAAEAERRRAESLLTKGASTPRETESASARAAGAEAAWASARDNLAYAVLRAPFAGRIGAMPVNVGDVVSPGTTLAEIEGEGGFEVQATMEADLAASLRPGLVAKVAVDGQSAPIAAVVRSVSPAGDPTTHRFEVRADLGAAVGLRSGTFARLVLPAATAEPRLTIPTGATIERGGLSGVFVVADGKAHLRWIAVGASSGGRTEVRAGLEAGERVAQDPAGLRDGSPVSEEH